MPDTPLKIKSNQHGFPNISKLASFKATQYYSYGIAYKGNIIANFLMDQTYLTTNEYPNDTLIYPNDVELLEGHSYSFAIGLGPAEPNTTIVRYRMVNNSGECF